MDRSSRLSGEDWQEWAERLLQRRHGPGEYQKVPDKQRGDAGIEGFTISAGHAYQAYGPEEPLTTSERYLKYRNKITTDIRKFIKNRSTLQAIFGAIRIKRWILLVPYFDSKEIIKHASKKTKEVIDAKLHYVDLDFRICVEDESVFAVERAQLLNADLRKISILGEDIHKHQIAEWADKNDLLVQKLDNKIARLPTIKSTDKRRVFRDEMIKHFLEGENTLEELRAHTKIIFSS